MFEGERLRVKCPKCKGNTLQVREVFEEIVVTDCRGGIVPAEATDHHAGDILGVRCWCYGCGHDWRPRGAASFADLLVPDNAEPGDCEGHGTEQPQTAGQALRDAIPLPDPQNPGEER